MPSALSPPLPPKTQALILVGSRDCCSLSAFPRHSSNTGSVATIAVNRRRPTARDEIVQAWEESDDALLIYVPVSCS